MNTKAEPKVYDLNISENYVPTWGAWEVGREVISNAIDADPKGYKIKTANKDKVIVTTKTRPTLAQVKFIGGGTKNASSGTIGCFGEGIKLAAMVAARLGGALRLRFDCYQVSYELKHEEQLGSRVCLMLVETMDDFEEGTTIEIELENIARELSGKFLDKTDPRHIDKQDEANLNLYNKGVWVASKPCKSLWDWNLHTSINRDRNVIDSWQIGAQIVQLMESQINLEMAEKLISPLNSDTFEIKCLTDCRIYVGCNIAYALMEAVKNKYGVDIVMASSEDDANRLARAKGHKVVLLDDNLRDIIKIINPENRIKVADEVVGFTDQVEVDYDSTKYDLAPLAALMDLMEESADVFVYTATGKTLGYAEFKNGRRRVYLNSCLFGPGQRSALLGTFIHEVAHITSKASDGKIAFESELTRLSGIVARVALERGK